MKILKNNKITEGKIIVNEELIKLKGGEVGHQAIICKKCDEDHEQCEELGPKLLVDSIWDGFDDCLELYPESTHFDYIEW